jgi:hypothetical protein
VTEFASVSAGEVGGWIQDERNLNQHGDAWVYGDARVSGDALVSGNAEVLWLSKVGSENGTLTAYKSKTGIKVNRVCFSGSIDEFEFAVNKTHGDSRIGREYRFLIEFIKLRLCSEC